VTGWKESALAAMAGEFTFMSVRLAVSFAHGPDDRIYRFVDRLLQSERRAGRIETTPGNKRKWRRVETR
jgi:hypothetical protein